MKRITTLLFALIIATSWSVAQTSPKPFAIYSKVSGTQLTIYYGDNWCHWEEPYGGTPDWYENADVENHSIVPSDADNFDVTNAIFHVTYEEWPEFDDIDGTWEDFVETVVFDSSLANLNYPVIYGDFFSNPLPKVKTIVGLENLDWSQVKSIDGMFSEFSSLESIDLSFLANSKKIEDMSYLFRDCTSLKSVDLSCINTENVRSLSLLFGGCTSLESVNLFSLNSMQEYLNMDAMFADCKSLRTLDLSNFDISNVGKVSMSDMFYGCSSLVELDLSNFDTSNVWCMERMFQDCSNLVSVYVGSGWSTEAIRYQYYGENMFTGCTSIVGQDGSVYDANCANDYKKAHYGPGGYLKFKGEQLPTDVSPIGAEKTVAFPTDGSLANTTVDDVYYNLTGDNGYDANEGCIVINESTTMTTGSDGGVRFSEFIGLKFMVNGKGVVDLDCQTYGRKRLYVMVGEGTEPKVYTEDPRGIVEVSYDVTEPTNIYVYAMDEAAAPRMVEAKSDCVKLWSLTVKPGATAIAPVTAAEQADGEYYTLDGRKLTGRPATAGVYVTGGRKVVVK